MIERPAHTCRPPDCPGTHMHPELARLLLMKPRPRCALRDFTCKCGRRWKICGHGWEPDKEHP